MKRYGDIGTGSVGFARDGEYGMRFLSVTVRVDAVHKHYTAYCPECMARLHRWVNWYDAKEYDHELKAECENGHIVLDVDILYNPEDTNGGNEANKDVGGGNVS